MSEKTANELFEKYTPLAESVAKKFTTTERLFSQEDALQESYTKLWEICLNGQASDYDGGWVRTVLTNHIATALRRIAHVPRHTFTKLRSIREAVETLRLEGAPATDANVAQHLGLSVEEVRRIIAYTYNRELISAEYVESCAPHDTLASTALTEALATLDDDAANMMQMVVEGYTYEEIGAKLGVSKQAVSQRVRCSIAKLRRLFDVDN